MEEKSHHPNPSPRKAMERGFFPCDNDGFCIEKAKQIGEASGPICGPEIPDFGNSGVFGMFFVISFFGCL